MFDLRRRNRGLVIAAVRRLARPSRTELAQATGLSASTISAIASDLLAERILREQAGGEGGAAKRGRPQVSVELDPTAAGIVAVTLALDHLSAALIDYSGAVVGQADTEILTQRATRAQLLQAVVRIVRQVVGEQDDREKILRVVLAVQGVVDRKGRGMLWSPITPWHDMPFAEAIEAETGLPATVENDCNVIAAALHASAPERFGENFLAVLLSHGIGMGLVLDGKLFAGVRSSGAEFGHMVFQPHGALCRCGRRGCVEAYAGDYAIRRRARGEDENTAAPVAMQPGEMEALAERARGGEAQAHAAFARAGEALGFALGSVFALVDPTPVAFVGAGATAFGLIEPSLREALGATAGGAGAESLRFSTELDEMPLIRAGCAARALQAADEITAVPGALASSARKRQIA